MVIRYFILFRKFFPLLIIFIFIRINYIVALIVYTISGSLATFANKTNSATLSTVQNITIEEKKLAKCKLRNFI
jgi:hypothetical protein